MISDFGVQAFAYLPDEIMTGGANDTILFSNGITRSNLRWNFDGKDLTFTLTDSPNDKLTIANFANPFYRIENFEVAGEQLTLETIFGSRVWQDTQETNSLEWEETAISYRGLGGDDTITTGSYNDLLLGDDGNDIINANGGDDTLNGGNGNDTLDGGEGNNRLNGADGDDSLISGSGQDTLYGASGNDTLNPGYGSDISYGGAGNDLIIEGYDNNDKDTLDGGAGNDNLQGGGNDDTYIFKKNYGSDVITDYDIQLYAYGGSEIRSGGINDKVIFGAGITRNNLRWHFEGENLVFTLKNSINDKLTISNYLDSSYRIENIEVEGTLLTADEIASQSIQNETLVGGMGNNILNGGAGDDVLAGREGNDTIAGSAGNDKVYGGADNDVLIGNEGKDTLNGESGHDKIYGGEGDDTLIGRAGNDILNGEAGIDSLFEWGDFNFTLTNSQLIGLGTDNINQIEKVHLTGGASDNLLTASNVTTMEVVMNGQAGNDTLIGGSNNDTLRGDAGSDRLEGKAGINSLIGGAGADIFVLNSVSGRDIIIDFTDGVDLLSLNPGLSFNNLSITNNASNTGVLIRDTANNNDLVAVIHNLNAGEITAEDFN